MLESHTEKGRRFVSLFIDFSTILGPKMAPQIRKKIYKNGFGSHFYRLFHDFGALRAPGPVFYSFFAVLGSFGDVFLWIFRDFATPLT